MKTTDPRLPSGRSRGQVLVLFALLLLALLGISALAIDYASWLVVDRNLQNAADHAALAGASAFENRASVTNCSGTKCFNARAQAWTSLNDELKLGLPSTAIGVVATRNSPDIGETSITDGVTTLSLCRPCMRLLLCGVPRRRRSLPGQPGRRLRAG